MLKIKSNLNVSLEIRSVLPNDFAKSIKSDTPIRDIIGIRYLNEPP